MIWDSGLDIRSDFYNIHYLADPIRDGLDAEILILHQVHIFGGDYAIPQGSRKISWVKRVSNAMDILGLPQIYFYVGPMVMMKNQKMGKSKGNVVHFNQLDYQNQKRVIYYLSDQLDKRKTIVKWDQASKKVSRMIFA